MTTPKQILTCDKCHQYTDKLSVAMFYWGTDQAGNVTAFSFGHKDCHPEVTDYSQELIWSATPELALERLAQLHVSYSWSAPLAKRLAHIMWAIPKVATDNDRAGAEETAKFF